MITLKKFLGINNVLAGERLTPQPRTGAIALATASNVDIGMDNELLRREGFALVTAARYSNVHQGDGFVLAVKNDDLISRVGVTETVLYPSLGDDRVWYCNLPDGRTTFSNDLINGIVTASARTTWGVPIPESVGTVSDVAGLLYAGDYRWSISYTRVADGMEGGPAYSGVQALAADKGLVWMGLPQEDGYRINVYLTTANGNKFFLAGTTLTTMFSFTGANHELVKPCLVDFVHPAPIGTLSAVWNGRVLVAEGSTLWASLPTRYEHFRLAEDFKRFSAPITLVQPVDNGIFVGTEAELAFLSGNEFSKLRYDQVIEGVVVLGSGVTVDGKLLRRGDDVGQGIGMVCIADRGLVAGFSDGDAIRITTGVYETAATEVAATFRVRDGIPQYIAIPQ